MLHMNTCVTHNHILFSITADQGCMAFVCTTASLVALTKKAKGLSLVWLRCRRLMATTKRAAAGPPTGAGGLPARAAVTA